MNEHLQQTAWWGRLKGEFGWDVEAIETDRGVVRVFRRRIGPVRFAYIPYGFPSPGGALAVVVESLRRGGAHAHLVRWDIPWDQEQFPRDEALRLGLQPAPVRVQPPDTVLLDLSPSEEEILGAMKSKTRYNIGLARKKGVSVERADARDPRFSEMYTQWYRAYQETARRDRLGIHPEHYYRRVIESAEGRDAPRVALYMAYHGEDVLGGAIVASWDGMSTYLYGAGSEKKRNFMASYLIQWEAIRDARHNGDRWYDFFGIPPGDDPSHAMHGLYRFKTGFGGTIVHRPGAWDLLLSPGVARLYRSAERARQWYYHGVRKRSVRRRARQGRRERG